MQKVRIGIIGCGVIGNAHLRQLADLDDAQVVAVADLREEAVTAAAETFGVAKTYDAGEKLIGDPDVDAVIVATVAAVHAPLVVAAFEAGKHVLCEKPLAMNADEARAMIAAQGDRVGACCSCRCRLLEMADVASEYFASGALGALRTVRCRATYPAPPPPEKTPPNWRMRKDLNAGGILTNWGCYDLDFLLGIAGWTLEPRWALARTFLTPAQYQDRLPEGQDAECHIVGTVTFQGGAILQYERAETYTGQAEATWSFQGEAGQLVLNMTSSNQGPLVTAHRAPADGGLESEVLASGPAAPRAGHASPSADFVRAIIDGTPPATSLEHALAVVRITDAFYASAERGCGVEVH